MDGESFGVFEQSATAFAEADKRLRGRASMSFSEGEVLWMDALLKAMVTKNHHRVRELSADRIAVQVAQKTHQMKGALRRDVERKELKRAERLVPSE